MTDDPADIEPGVPPPTASRVAARALVLAVVSCRGFIDTDAADAGDLWTRIEAWFSRLALNGELEEWEKAFIAKPLGTLEDRERIDATWLSEGLLVLAWALGRYGMPPYDQPIVAAEVTDALGLLKPDAETVLAKRSLRSPSELEDFRQDIFAINWRLREFRVTGQPIDFATVAKTAWFGSLSLARVRLVDGDLAIGATRIDKTDKRMFHRCASIVQERHRAINWLLGDSSKIYSEVGTST